MLIGFNVEEEEAEDAEDVKNNRKNLSTTIQ